MGLDMYLTKKHYIGAHYDHPKVKGTIKIKIQDIPVDIDIKKISYIEEIAGYWRKANAIHKWFVENCQGGQDDCGTYEIQRTDLRALNDICIGITKDHSLANELLPTQNGCFFGDIEYNEEYFQDIENTIKIIQDLHLENGCSFEIYYHSSW